VFTTHTPVAAGNETYPREEVIGTVGDLMAELGVEGEALLRLGRYHPEDDGERFGMTTFSLRMSRAANGVSRRHGGVSREMWSGLWPRQAVEAVPIAHVTNGAHRSSRAASDRARCARSRCLGGGAA
jgi:starch phosphorylase